MTIAGGHKASYYVINGITLYRLISAPVLLLLALNKSFDVFKWLLALSFFTDAIDGPLSRRYNVTSVFGSRFDSIADDASVLVATLCLWIIHPDFVRDRWIVFAMLWALFVIQTIAALIAYGKTTSFHTYLAKVAAVSQGIFFILIFFGFGAASVVFYIAAFLTGLELLEEIILVRILPEWRTNVRGLFWIQKPGRRSHTNENLI